MSEAAIGLISDKRRDSKFTGLDLKDRKLPLEWLKEDESPESIRVIQIELRIPPGQSPEPGWGASFIQELFAC
jgi:hypothetical protein